MSAAPADAKDDKPAPFPAKGEDYDPVAAWTLLLILVALILLAIHSRGNGAADDRDGGDYVAQVFSGVSRARAEAYGAAIRRRHSRLLGGLAVSVEAAGRHGSQADHRVLVGPFSRKRDAEALCRSLRLRDVDCLAKASWEALE
jgi:hypothetical protein